MSKPTDLTPAVQSAICAAILGGMHLSPAAEACGVPAHTALEWLRRGEGRAKGRPANATYATFAAAVREAEAECERALVMTWRASAVKDNDRASIATFLARRFPDRWANKEKHEHSGPGGGPIQVQPIDYRAASAPLAPGPMAHSPAPGPDEGTGDGPEVG